MGSSPSNFSSIPENDIDLNRQTEKQYCGFNTLVKENIRILEKYQLTEGDLGFLYETLKKQFFTKDASEAQIQQLARKFQKAVCKVDDGWLFKQGSTANYLFIIAEGKVDVIKESYFVRNLKVGDLFGELALLYGNRRSSSIKIQKDACFQTQYFVLQKSAFLDFIRLTCKGINQQIEVIFDEILPFKYLPYHQKKQLAKRAFKISFNTNRRIFTRYDQPYALFVILEGTVKKIFPFRPTIFLKSKKSFGYHGSNRSDFSASVAQDCTCIAIGKQSIDQILKQNIMFMFLSNRLRHILMWNKELREISNERIMKLVTKFNFKRVKAFHLVCQLKQFIEHLYVPIDCLSIENVENIFGLQQILKGERYYERDLVAEKQGYIAVITVEEFNELLEISEYGKKFNKVTQFKPFDIRFCKQIECLKYNSLGQPFQILYEEPKFGQLFLFCKYFYDIPGEEEIFDTKLSILKELQTPFVRGFYYYFKNFQYGTIYHQFIPGVNLNQIFNQIGPFSLTQSKFYISNILLLFQELHKINTISRQWCISDFTVDYEGFIFVTDFQKSKKFMENSDTQKDKRTKTIQKTPHECSPQMILKESYGTEVDFWGIGLLFYYFIFGRYPFGDDEKDPFKIYDCILNDQLTYPLYLRSKQPKEVLSLCLSREKQQREGLNAQILKGMSFFRGVEWQQIIKKEASGHYIPSVRQNSTQI